MMEITKSSLIDLVSDIINSGFPTLTDTGNTKPQYIKAFGMPVFSIALFTISESKNNPSAQQH